MDPDPAASHETQSSNLASTRASIEDDDAKVANLSENVASLASQMKLSTERSCRSRLVWRSPVDRATTVSAGI